MAHILCSLLPKLEIRMFAAVLAATLFMLSATTGGSATDSCTASLPPLVGGGDECSASGGGDLVNRSQTECLCFAARGGTLYAT